MFFLLKKNNVRAERGIAEWNGKYQWERNARGDGARRVFLLGNGRICGNFLKFFRFFSFVSLLGETFGVFFLHIGGTTGKEHKA